MEKESGKMTVIEETEADLKETERKISLRESGSEKISATEEMADLEKTGKIDVSLRKNEPEETGTSRQTETDSMQSSSGDCGTLPPLNITVCIFLSVKIFLNTVSEKHYQNNFMIITLKFNNV